MKYTEKNRQTLISTTIVSFLAAALVMTAAALFSGSEIYAATDGTWVLTSTDYYTPSAYTSRQNSYYKYHDEFRGFTQDGFVQFWVSGGYVGPGDSHTADVYHECSQPEKSYAPGAVVSITLRTRQESTVGGYKGGCGSAYICKEDTAWPKDGRSRFYKNNIANFQDPKGSFAMATPGITVEATAAMPKSAEYGDRIAIVFDTDSSSDGINQAYESNYGGHQIYEWIYTFQKPATVKKPGKGVVSSIKNVKGAKAKVTVKKIKTAKKYQIRYKVDGSKKWTSKEAKTNIFTISVKKGKKVSVQARVRNSAGWGKWGTKKTFKTDKK